MVQQMNVDIVRMMRSEEREREAQRDLSLGFPEMVVLAPVPDGSILLLFLTRALCNKPVAICDVEFGIRTRG